MLCPVELVEKPNRAFASEITDIQPDLLYMKSVLVSTGKNANDDVFLPEEVWAARLSPKLKPVDWEHNTGNEVLDSAVAKLIDPKKVIHDNQIVGVMYDVKAVDENGPIDETQENFKLPAKFNLVNEAVIYKYLYPKTAAKIVREAKDNKLFVSMEAWFSNHDYKVGNKIVARNEKTSFLDKHLRAYGGDGTYNGERVGRVLRNIVFGGVGLVSRPANKDSVIESFTNASEEVKIMANETEVKVDEAKVATDKLVAVEASLTAKEAELAAAAKKIEELLAAKAEVDFAAEKASKTLVDVEANLAKVKAELDAALAKLAAIELAKVYASRLAAITDGLKLAALATDSDEVKSKKVARAEKLAKLVEKYSDEAFASWLADIQDVLSLAAMPPWMKDEDKDEEDKKKKKEDKAECSTASEILDTKVLESVKAEASIPAGNDNAGNVVKLSDKMKSLAAELLPAAKK
jgi:hypothetical protein